MPKPIGIDLGTTYSAVATINGAGQPEIVRNSDGQSITPSVVLFDNGEAIVGQQAKLQRAAFADDIVEFVKRQMGSDALLPERRQRQLHSRRHLGDHPQAAGL
jgi:molecular chaperone DnaK